MDQRPGPMTLDGRHTAFLRAQLRGDEAVMRQAGSQLSESGGLDLLVPLIHHAFVLTVRRAFGGSYSRRQVIRLASRVREMPAEMRNIVDPVAAESEILRALGSPASEFPDPEARAIAQAAVLNYLVRDLELDDRSVSELLEQARAAADQSLDQGISLPACTGSASAADRPDMNTEPADAQQVSTVSEAGLKHVADELLAENRDLKHELQRLRAEVQVMASRIDALEARTALGPGPGAESR